MWEALGTAEHLAPASEGMACTAASVVPLARATSLSLPCHLSESLSSCESLQKWTGQRKMAGDYQFKNSREVGGTLGFRKVITEYNGFKRKGSHKRLKKICRQMEKR